MFMDDRTIAQIAPSGAFFGNPYPVNCANPFLSASELTAWCGGSTAGFTYSGTTPGNNLYIGRRNVEGGNRQDDIEHEDFRLVTGVRGKIADGWDYDASFQYGIVNLSDTYLNDVSTTKIGYALDVINVNGVPTCQVVANGVQSGLGLGCVPWNIFTPGGVTKAATNYIDTPGDIRGKITQTIVNANFTGDLGQYGVQLPTATSGLKVNFGAEYRDEKSFSQPDAEFVTGDLAGQGGPQPAISGGVVSRDAFLEARMPLRGRQVHGEGAERRCLVSVLELLARASTPTPSRWGSTGSPSRTCACAAASPARCARRTSSNCTTPIRWLWTVRSIRARAAAAPPAASAAQCARSGVTAARIRPRPRQLRRRSTTASPAATRACSRKPRSPPRWASGSRRRSCPNFRAQFDYYDIKIENVIETIGANTIITECVNAGLFCNDVHRNAIGSLWIGNTGYVIDSLANVGQLHERGIDADLSYAIGCGCRWARFA